MEAVELLSFILAIVIVSLAHYHRRRSTARSLRQPTIKIGDAAVARQALIDQADTFSNRPATLFPVPLITDRRQRSRSHGLTTVPYGPHWRALRSNLNAAILQPWRQGLLGPLQQDAMATLVAGLSTGDVVIRDRLYPAVFAMLARVCFGDDVDAHHERSMEHMMLEFRGAIAEAKVFARSTMARLWHWRKWRRFLGFRTQQAALFAPLIEAARRRRQHGHGAGGRRPYVDSLIDNRSIPDEDDPGAKRALTDGEMVSLLVEFLGVAEGVITTVEWTLAHLVNQPEVQAKLRRELKLVAGKTHGGSGNDDGSVFVSDSGKCSAGGRSTTTYLHAVVLEALRLHPPFPLIARDVRSEGTPVQLGTETVPAGGMRVQFILGDIGKDEKMWTDPGEFRPERFLAGGEGEGVGPVPAGPKEIRMMPFGAGQRACPGAAMAVQFIEGFLAVLVREFEWAAPGEQAADNGGSADGGVVDMTELYGFIRMMKSPLRAHIIPCA